MGKILEVRKGLEMLVEVVHANGGASAQVTCPPEGPFQASLGEIRTLAALRAGEANQVRVGRRDWIDASEIRGLRINTMMSQARELAKRYEEAAGEYLTTMQLRAKAESLGLLTRETIEKIEEVIRTEPIERKRR